MSKYFFGSDEDRKCIVPFEHYTEESASWHRLEDHNMDYKIEVLDSHKALNQLHSVLCNMVMVCRSRKNKPITLDEEDISLLFEMASKSKMIKF